MRSARRLSDLPSPRELADRARGSVRHLPSARELSERVPSPRNWLPRRHVEIDWKRGAGILAAGVLLGVGITLLLAPRVRHAREERQYARRARRGDGEARASL